MEKIVDFDYVLGSIDEPDPSPKSTRLKFRRERDSLFEAFETYENFRHYGPQFTGQTVPDFPDWSRLIRELQTFLAEGAKDLWVCAWLTECLVAKHGFQGLAQGFELLYRICDECWEKIEPSPSDEGVEHTLKMLIGFSKGEHFIDQIRMAPITPAVGSHDPATCGTISHLDASVRSELLGATNDEFIMDLNTNLRTAAKFWGLLESCLKQKADGGHVPFAKIKETLEQCQRTLMMTFPRLETLSVPLDHETSEQNIVDTSTASTTVSNPRPDVTNHASHLLAREQAFRTLESLSNFFKENEPNSPVSLALLQAIKWGKMTFQELMEEMLNDDVARISILRLAGASGTKTDDE